MVVILYYLVRNSPLTKKFSDSDYTKQKPGKTLKNFLFFNFFLQNGRQLKYSIVTSILYGRSY